MNTILWTLREAMRYVFSLQAFMLVLKFSYCISFCLSFLVLFLFFLLLLLLSQVMLYLDLALRAASTIAHVMLIFVTPLTCKMWSLITLLATNDCSY